MRLPRVHGRFVLGILMSAAALALILKDVSLPELIGALRRANYWWQIPSVAALVGAMWLRAARWRALLGERLPIRRSFHIQNVGSLLNNVLPLRLGELSKAYLASRGSGLSVMEGLSSVLIERLLDVLSVFALLLVVLPWVPGDAAMVRASQLAAAAALLVVVGLFVAASPRVPTLRLARAASGWLPAKLRDGLLARGEELLRGVSAAGGWRLVAAIGWSLATWIGWGLSAYATLRTFVPDASWQAAGFVTCAIALGLSIPSAPSGAGLYEAAAVAGLVVFGVASDTAFAFALTLHLATFLVVAALGVVGLEREGENFGHLTAAARTLWGRSRAR